MGPQRITTAFYTCSFPGCPAPVKVSLSLVSSLQDLVQQTDGDLQGVLQGVRTPGGTEVHNCRPVPAFSPEAMARAASEREVVGYYRVRAAETMALTDVEESIADQSFGKPGSVVLLIQRREGVSQANFFFRENGAIVNLSLLMFPLDAQLLEERRASLKVMATRSPAPAAATAVAAEPDRRNRWALIAAGVVAAVGLAAGAWIAGRRGAPVESAEAASTARSTVAPLPLRAERQGADLKVVWDLGSAQIANAVSGVLDIDDGGVKRRIPLDTRQVRFGSVLYTPKSSEVSIDLTAVKPDGSAGQASVLVLLTATAGAAAPQVRNVAPPAMQAQAPQPPKAADSRLAARAAVRPFVPPAEKRTETPSRDVESLPTAELRTESATVRLPEVVAPAPPPPQQAPASKPVVTAPPVQRVEAVAPSTVGQGASSAAAVYYAPQLVSQVGARVPPELRQFLTRPFTVSVRATIDETGRVVHAEAPQQKVIHIGFLAAANEAAMRCRFIPARRGNTPVKGEAVLTFRFQ